MSGNVIRQYSGKALDWIHACGMDSEEDFWKEFSGLDKATVPDHIHEYLGSLGYTGTLNEKWQHFLRDQTSYEGTNIDMFLRFIETVYSPTPPAGSGTPVGLLLALTRV